jgi:hypothetical protein
MRRALALVRAVSCCAMLGVTARAQTAASPTQHLAFDRPEAWAQQYFTSVSMLTGLEMAAADESGSVRVQIEGGWIPPLSASQQRVGFAGTASEDLNKAPMFLRPRVQIGLPARLSVIIGGVPPIRAFGVTPRLFDAAIEWAMVESPAWRLAWRGHGQIGTVTGAFTCPASVVGLPAGGSANPTGCDTTSDDVASLRYGALEFDASRRIARLNQLTPHAAVSINAVESRFQVDAHTFGGVDRTLLDTGGVTWSISTGAALPIGRKVELAADAFYTPLMVRRVTIAPRTVDGLFNIRVLVSYRLR